MKTKPAALWLCAFLPTSNFSFSKVSTYKRLTTLIVEMTYITKGHLSTCVNKTVIYHFTFFPSSVVSQLEIFLSALDATQACHNCTDKPSPFLSIFHVINIYFHPN